MKTFLPLFFFFVSITGIDAQAPEFINYQAAARDNNGNILVNQNVGFRLGIYQGSTSGVLVYLEEHLTTTNAHGMVNLLIGNGTVVAGSFSGISWNFGPYFLEVQLSVNSGPYQTMGTTQFVSVPYALYAERSGDRPIAGEGLSMVHDTINSSWSAVGNDQFSNNTGNVGIGVAPVSEKLEIDGAIKVGTTANSVQGTIRYTGSDFEGFTPMGWTSLTQSTTALNNYEYVNYSFNYINSIARNTMVLLDTDSLIVPESGTYLVLYNGSGSSTSYFDIGLGIWDSEGRTGVINTTQGMNWLGDAYDMFIGRYQVNTNITSYFQYMPLTFSVQTIATLNAGDVLKPGAVVFSNGSPSSNWYVNPRKIQIIKIH